jgi:hypothetical protein
MGGGGRSATARTVSVIFTLLEREPFSPEIGGQGDSNTRPQIRQRLELADLGKAVRGRRRLSKSRPATAGRCGPRGTGVDSGKARGRDVERALRLSERRLQLGEYDLHEQLRDLLIEVTIRRVTIYAH